MTEALDIPGLMPGQSFETWTALTESLRTDPSSWAVIVGAGISQGADIPGWESLMKLTAAEFQLSVATMKTIAYPTFFADCESIDPIRFWNHIQASVCHRGEPTPNHWSIAQIPFGLFVTLNYDRLLEEPWQASSDRPLDGRLVFPAISKNTLLGGGRLLYLHGRCPEPGDAMDETTVVLTEATYQSNYEDDLSLLQRTVANIFCDYNVLFLGTSGDDLALEYLVNRIRIRESTGKMPSHHRVVIAGTQELEYSSSLVYGHGSVRHSKFLFYQIRDKSHADLERLLAHLARAVVA